MAISTPKSQKTRTISFILDDLKVGVLADITLFIRPEDLTRTDPSRMSVQQTLTGAWVDNSGRGLANITISGHLGWRRSDNAGGLDGEQRFRTLKKQIYDEWHLRRNRAASEGRDPEEINLIFVDVLDGFAIVVAPLSFVLRRSKTRPLLMQYQISLMGLEGSRALFNDKAMPSARRPPNFASKLAAISSIINSVTRITNRIATIRNDTDRNLVSPVAKFMRDTSRLYTAVTRAIEDADETAESLVTVARLSAQAGVNIFRTAAAVAGIPGLAKMRLMQIAGDYSNILCVIRSAVRSPLLLPDYSPLYGASNCSSTSGGRPPSPLSGVNPFFLVSPTTQAPIVEVTAAAQRNLQILAVNDVVLAPLSADQLISAVNQVAEGMAVA